MITLTKRLDFYAAMLKANAFTPSALAVAFVLLYRHLNGRTGRCDPSAATLAYGTGLTVRGVEKAIAELRQSGWWEIKQGGGRGCTNRYAPHLERVNVGSGFKGRKAEQPFGDLAPKIPNHSSQNPERQFTRTNKNQNTARYARLVDSAKEDFETFWCVYPHRGDHPDPKKPARLKFSAAVKAGADPADIIRGAENYAAYVAANVSEPRYVAQAQTWLSQERWNDYQEAPEPPRLRVGMN